MLENLSKTTKIWIFIFAGIVLIGGAMVYYFNNFGKPALFKGIISVPRISPEEIGLIGTRLAPPSNVKVSFTSELPLDSRIPFNSQGSKKLGTLDFVSSDKDLILNKLIFSFNGFESNERQRIGFIQLSNPQPNANLSRLDIPIYSNSTIEEIEENTNFNILLERNSHIPVEVWLQIEQDFPTSRLIEIMIKDEQAIKLNETNVEITGLFPIKIAKFTRTPPMPRFNIPQSGDEGPTVSTQPPTSIPGVELQTLPQEQGERALSTTIEANLASDTPSASNIFPGETKDILKFTLSASRSAEITGITFTKTNTSTTPNADFRDITLFENNSQLDDPNELQTFGDNNKIYFPLSKNLTAGTTSAFTVKAVLKDNVLDNTKFKIGIATPFNIDTAQNAEITGNFPMKSNEFTVARSEAEQPREDQRILDLQNEIDRLQRELEAARRQDQPDSAIADLQNQLRDLQNQMRSAATSCETQGKFTYQGRCIDCSVEQYVANGGRCQQTQATSRRRFRLPTLAGADIFEIEEGVRAEVTETAPGPAERPAAQEPTLQSTARLASAPEKGDTGPEIFIYIGILGAAHLIRRLIRK